MAYDMADVKYFLYKYIIPGIFVLLLPLFTLLAVSDFTTDVPSGSGTWSVIGIVVVFAVVYYSFQLDKEEFKTSD